MKDKYNLDFTIDIKYRVGITKLGVSFNKDTIKLLDYPQKVNIGIDIKNGILAVRNAKDSYCGKKYRFWEKNNCNFVRINTRAIVKTIERITGITYGLKCVYYAAYYDYEEKMLIVNLKKKKEEKQ